MPIREYECESCGRRFERIQKFSDPPIEECPHCGGHVHKMISSPAFQFKGTGWYVTDYARKDSGGSKPAGESNEAASSKESKETTGTEKDSTAKKTETSSSPSSAPTDKNSPKSGT